MPYYVTLSQVTILAQIGTGFTAEYGRSSIHKSQNKTTFPKWGIVRKGMVRV